ncbi:MAG: aspartate kinase [Bacteroidetes bacterium]|nr:MAG: aspartate kinase [Bacteroidota bacterium]
MQKRNVIKIGGSILKNIQSIQQIVKVLKSHEHLPVIVVSAFYGVTERIRQSLENLFKEEDMVTTLYDFLYQKKSKIILELIKDVDIRNETFTQVAQQLNELRQYLQGIFFIRHVPEKANDFILSFGEKLSAIVLNGVFRDKGINSGIVFPEKAGLITDGVFGNASVDLKSSIKKVADSFTENQIYVVPGFYGVSKKKEITLLGKGGTDYSAAAFAHCLNVKSLDIWKDVDGFMTGDPKIVTNPKPIRHLTYSEAAELAYFGAGILHPRTVEPVSITNIPIRIFNIFKDYSFDEVQTVIDNKISIHPEVTKSITVDNNTGILSIKGPGVGYIPGILSEITKILNIHAININSVITSQISINLLLNKDIIEKASNLIQELNIPAITNIIVKKEVALIAIVGNGMTEAYGVGARILSAVSEEGINIHLSSIGASDVVTYLIVDEKNTKKALLKLHEALFQTNNQYQIKLNYA